MDGDFRQVDNDSDLPEQNFGPGKIIHVDMDAFYASAELLRRPDLAEKPVAVGGRPDGRGVISTCNYVARKFGVHSAMSSSRALKVCPDLIFIRPDFSHYKKLSRQVREIFEQYTDKIQPLSLDEAYLDVTDCTEFGGSATLIAKDIRMRIESETGLTASAGVAPNKFLAKVGSDWKKPNGLFVLPPDKVAEFVKKLPVRKIPGVGKKSAERMYRKGFQTCGDLQQHSLEHLTSYFGQWAEYLYNVSRGIDFRPVRSSGVRKSLSLERTYSEDLPNWDRVLEKLPELFDELQSRLERSKKTDSPIASQFVKVKFFDFKQTTMEERYPGELKIENFESLLQQAFLRRAEPVRLLGLGVRFQVKEKKKSAPGQMALF